MMTDLEELERLHAAALDWDGDAADGCLGAFPGLIAELRALRDAAEAARDYVENYGGDNENDRTRRRALAAALAKVPK